MASGQANIFINSDDLISSNPQSVKTICWTVRGSNPSGARFSARPYRPWGPPSLLYSGYRVFPGG